VFFQVYKAVNLSVK